MKKERKEVRISKTDLELIKEAAKNKEVSVSSYMVLASVNKAKRDIKDK